jgi:hypothetical protein
MSVSAKNLPAKTVSNFSETDGCSITLWYFRYSIEIDDTGYTINSDQAR